VAAPAVRRPAPQAAGVAPSAAGEWAPTCATATSSALRDDTCSPRPVTRPLEATCFDLYMVLSWKAHQVTTLVGHAGQRDYVLKCRVCRIVAAGTPRPPHFADTMLDGLTEVQHCVGMTCHDVRHTFRDRRYAEHIHRPLH
jgi:hypothetical protein